MWHYADGMGWWILFGSAWMFVFWGGLIALIVWEITKLSGRGNSNVKQNPLEAAKERYARGEITKTDFERLKKDIA